MPTPDTKPERLLIGQLAQRVNLDPRTIRYYESVSLLPEPDRSESGYRLYSQAEEERLRFVIRARRIGFTLGEIKEIFALRDQGEPPCQYVRETLDHRISDIDQHLADLRALKVDLTQLRNHAHSMPPRPVRSDDYCHILEL